MFWWSCSLVDWMLRGSWQLMSSYSRSEVTQFVLISHKPKSIRIHLRVITMRQFNKQKLQQKTCKNWDRDCGVHHEAKATRQDPIQSRATGSNARPSSTVWKTQVNRLETRSWQCLSDTRCIEITKKHHFWSSFERFLIFVYIYIYLHIQYFSAISGYF